jgi:hypothetical protein
MGITFCFNRKSRKVVTEDPLAISDVGNVGVCDAINDIKHPLNGIASPIQSPDNIVAVLRGADAKTIELWRLSLQALIEETRKQTDQARAQNELARQYTELARERTELARAKTAKLLILHDLRKSPDWELLYPEQRRAVITNILLDEEDAKEDAEAHRDDSLV